MKGTERLHGLGQSLWLDYISRDLLNSGKLKRYIDEFSVTGLTSNPTIFDQAINNSTAYDAAIRLHSHESSSAEELFFAVALEDISRAAELFRSVHERTNRVDGWVSLELSPLLAHDSVRSVSAARELFRRAGLPNLFIKIPGTKEGLGAIEESIFAGVPVNITLLFSREQYLAAADAYMRGIERRVAAGLNAEVASVASVFISRWDVAVAKRVSPQLRDRLGIAMGKRIYAAFNSVISSDRSRRLYNFGARPQRLLWGSTGTKNPEAPKTLYAAALAAPFTVNTMPEDTLNALAVNSDPIDLLQAHGGDGEEVLAQFTKEGIDVAALAEQLQDEGAKSFINSWNDLIHVLENKL
jgi:transaldolase